MSELFRGWELLALSFGSLFSAWVMHALGMALTAAKRLALHERVYSDESCKLGLAAVMERVRALHVYSERREVVGTMMQPAGLVIGPTFVACVERVSASERSIYGHGPMVRVRVVRWRWMPPLVPDDVCAENVRSCPPGVIRVMRRSCDPRSGSGWVMRLENACPAAVPCAAAAASRDVAAKIVELHRASGQSAQVRVVLSGGPGIGKSTAARVVAEILGAVLIPGLDPSRPGHSVSSALSAVSSHAVGSPHVVVSLDEFDVCLRRAVAGLAVMPPTSNESTPPEVTDKASWNALMDALQFVPNVTLVMSTNLSFAELDTLDASGAMLRAGRVTQRIAMGVDGTVNVFDRPPTNKKNKMKRRGPPFYTNNH